jgi:FdhE protein
MHRTPSHVCESDIRPRLDAVARQNPEWRPWLTLLAEALHEREAPVWLAAVPPSCPERPTVVPLLAGMALTLEPRLARSWIRRLLKQATKGTGPVAASLAAANTRHLDALGLLEAAVCQDEARLADLSKTAGVEPRALGAVVQLATLPLLQACRRHLASQVPTSWAHGYCPVCGAWPTLAEVRGLERSRRLRCGRCGGDWGVPWLRCPYCGEAEHQRLGALVLEGNGMTRTLETCATCKGYVKTLTTLQASSPYAVILADLATVDLDIVALQYGYTRPAPPGYPLGVRLTEPLGRIQAFFGRHMRADRFADDL